MLADCLAMVIRLVTHDGTSQLSTCYSTADSMVDIGSTSGIMQYKPSRGLEQYELIDILHKSINCLYLVELLVCFKRIVANVVVVRISEMIA